MGNVVLRNNISSELHSGIIDNAFEKLNKHELNG